jgi:hypothetical protein
MARADTYTFLPLDSWARLMNLNPAHFNGGVGSSVSPQVFPLKRNCDGVWYQYGWQHSDQLSREELAETIDEAETEIAAVLGYFPAPRWVSKEIHRFPLPHRRDVFRLGGRDVRGAPLSVLAKNKKIILGGRRATSMIAKDQVVAFSDPDGDGFTELAAVSSPTTVTDICEIKLYFPNTDGAPEWEIRPVLSKALSGGVVTFLIDSWMLIDPDLWGAYPTDDGPDVVDIGEVSNFIGSVDIVREYNDTTQPSCEFFWECPNCGTSATCAACSFTAQTGCMYVRDTDRGLVVPRPATYDAAAGTWSETAWATPGRDPDQVRLWYKSGDIDEFVLSDEGCFELKDDLARTIAYLAAARLKSPVCGCPNTKQRVQYLQEDLAHTPAGAGFRAIPNDVIANPFGTRRGEVMAWRKIAQLGDREVSSAIV